MPQRRGMGHNRKSWVSASVAVEGGGHGLLLVAFGFMAIWQGIFGL